MICQICKRKKGIQPKGFEVYLQNSGFQSRILPCGLEHCNIIYEKGDLQKLLNKQELCKHL